MASSTNSSNKVSLETPKILAVPPPSTLLIPKATDKTTEVGQKIINQQNSNGSEGNSNCCKRFWKSIKEIAIKILRVLLFCFPCLFKKQPKTPNENPVIPPATPNTPSQLSSTTPSGVNAPTPENAHGSTPIVPTEPVVPPPPLPPEPTPPAVTPPATPPTSPPAVTPPATPPTPPPAVTPPAPPPPKVTPPAKDLEYCAAFMTRVSNLQEKMIPLSKDQAWSDWTSIITIIGPVFQELQDINTWFELYNVKENSKLADAKARFDMIEKTFIGFLAAKSHVILNMVDLIKNLESELKRSTNSDLSSMKSNLIYQVLPMIRFMCKNGVEVEKASAAQSYIEKLIPLAPTNLGGSLVMSSTTENVNLGIANSGNLCYVIATMQVLMRNKIFLKALQQPIVTKKVTVGRNSSDTEATFQARLSRMQDDASKKHKTLTEMRDVLLNIQKYRNENNFIELSKATDQLRKTLFQSGTFQDFVKDEETDQQDAPEFINVLLEIAGFELDFHKYKLQRQKDGSLEIGDAMEPTGNRSLAIPCRAPGSEVLTLQKCIDLACPAAPVEKRDYWARDFLKTSPTFMMMQMQRYVPIDVQEERARIFAQLKAITPSLGTDAELQTLAAAQVRYGVRKIETRFAPPPSFIVNLRENIDPKVEQGLPINYRLTGCILHSGTSPRNGHYIAVVHDKGKWYRCDDATVTEQTEEQAREAFASAYLIFGERVPNPKVETKV